MSYAKLNEESTSIPQPNGLNIELMEHQKRAVFALSQLEKNGHVDLKNFLYYDNKEKDLRIDTRIGILGDKVGSGKSLMIVALILISDELPRRTIYYSSDKYVSIKSLSDNYEFNKCNLLIVPDHLVNQWSDFFKYAPKIKTQILTKDNNVDKDSKVCIVPSNLAVKLFDKHTKTLWNRVIIDEADSIKLQQHDILANFVWLVTGTPSGIATSKTKYLKLIFGKNINWVTDSILVKNDNEYINNSMKLPTLNRITVNCYTPSELKIIQEFIPKSVVRMINAGNTDQAILALNCHVDTKDNIFKVIINAINNAIHNKNLELEAEKKKIYSVSNTEIGKRNIKRLEKSINNLKCRSSAIKTKIKESEDPICPVCMGDPDEDNSVMVDCCGAIFCFDCLALTANQNKCLYCFQKIAKKSMHVMTKKKLKKNDKKIKTKEKIDALLEIINSKKNSKILVFANYSETFEKIQLELKNNKITYAILKGNNKGELINKFKAGKLKVLMLNATNFGAGLNLQDATDVVIYHRFSKETEEQVIGRAQRLGRKDQLNVYYLIHENENVAFGNTFAFEDIDYEKFLNENNDEQ